MKAMEAPAYQGSRHVSGMVGNITAGFFLYTLNLFLIMPATYDKIDRRSLSGKRETGSKEPRVY